MKTVNVTIGNHAVTYVVAATTAPKACDGFGTFTIEEFDTVNGKAVRLVLIGAEHLTWQTSRYSSGLEAWTTEAGRFEYFDPDFVEVEPLLWKRLSGDGRG